MVAPARHRVAWLAGALLVSSAWAAPVFEQSAEVGPLSQSSVSLSLTPRDGNTLVVAAAFRSSLASPAFSCRDDANNPWTAVAPQLQLPSFDWIQQVWLASGISVDGGLVVQCGSSDVTAVEFVVLEYSGVDVAAPLDGVAMRASGDVGVPFDAGMVITSQPDARLVSWTIGWGYPLVSLDPAFTVHSTIDGDLVQDAPAPTPGPYSTRVDVGGQRWANTLLALRAAPEDAGRSDAGFSDAGAGDAGVDAGTADGGLPPDGGGAVGPEQLAVGCSCDASPVAVAAGLAVFVAWRRGTRRHAG